jgi:hypothetical protein
MNRDELIKLISEYLEKVKYTRADNYKTYSNAELIKVCKMYKIHF